jgi:hypothetical protein
MHAIREAGGRGSAENFVKRFFLWIMLTFSYFVWGYGERPSRTLFAGILLIFLSAFLYIGGNFIQNGNLFKPSFFQAFYFSVVTFTTVGYGDIIAVGFNKAVAMLEAFCGIFIMPLFIIGLSRKYLRI